MMEPFHSGLTVFMWFTAMYVLFLDLIKDSWDLTTSLCIYIISASLLLSNEMLMHFLTKRQTEKVRTWRKVCTLLLLLLLTVFILAVSFNTKMETSLKVTIGVVSLVFFWMIKFVEKNEVAAAQVNEPNYTCLPECVLISQFTPFTIMHVYLTCLGNPTPWSIVGSLVLSLDHHLLHLYMSKASELSSRAGHEGEAKIYKYRYTAATYALVVVPAVVLTFCRVPTSVLAFRPSKVEDHLLSKLPKIWHGFMSLLSLIVDHDRELENRRGSERR